MLTYWTGSQNADAEPGSFYHRSLYGGRDLDALAIEPEELMVLGGTGVSHRCIGGYVTPSLSPVRVPSPRHRYVIVDLGGYADSVQAGVCLLG